MSTLETSKDMSPSMNDFTAMLNETLAEDVAYEGNVVRGKIVGDREGVRADRRRPQDGRPRAAEGVRCRRQAGGSESRRRGRGLPGAHRERARRGRAVARQGSSRGELDASGEAVRGRREGQRHHLQQGQGRLHGRSRRRGGVPAGQPGRHPPGARHRPADASAAAVPDPEDGPPARQHRGLAPLRARGDARRAARRHRRSPRGGPGDRRRGQEHHRLRCVHRPRRHRRPAARHRHGVAPRVASLARSSTSAIP